MGRFEEPGGQKLFGPKEVPYPYRRPKAPSSLFDPQRVPDQVPNTFYFVMWSFFFLGRFLCFVSGGEGGGGYRIRPFLMQSDSASQKRPFSTGLFFD